MTMEQIRYKLHSFGGSLSDAKEDLGCVYGSKVVHVVHYLAPLLPR